MITVAMATYNGEAYLPAQVASILEQLPPDGLLLVRDDGSTDGTRALLAGLGDPRVTVLDGPRLGASGSFMALLAAVPPATDIVFFADQDDVWLPGKIERARVALAGPDNAPALYCSRLRLVDGDLKDIGLSPPFARGPSFENALVENIATGCTIALNRAARAAVLKGVEPGQIEYHDHWCYLVVSALGRVIFDSEPSVLYRQHGGNAIGMGEGLRYVGVVLRILGRENLTARLIRQNRLLMAAHGADLTQSRRTSLQRACSRWGLLFNSSRWRQRLDQELALRALLVAEALPDDWRRPVLAATQRLVAPKPQLQG